MLDVWHLQDHAEDVNRRVRGHVPHGEAPKQGGGGTLPPPGSPGSSEESLGPTQFRLDARAVIHVSERRTDDPLIH